MLFFDLLGLCDIEQIARNAIVEIAEAKVKEMAGKKAAKAAAKFALAAVIDGPLPIGEIVGAVMLVADTVSAYGEIKALWKLAANLESEVLGQLTPDLRETLRRKAGDCCDTFAANMVNVATAKMAGRRVGSALKKAFGELRECCKDRKGVAKGKRKAKLRGDRVRKKIGKRIPNSQLLGPPPRRGRAAIGRDGHPVELHHRGQRPDSPLDEMTRTDHRGKGNFSKNHSNTGQEPSKIDRKAWKKEQKAHWEQEWDRGRFDDFDD